MEGGGGGGTRQDKKKEKKELLLLSSPSSSIIIIIIIIELYALFFFRTVTDEKKKRQRDASKRALARLVPPKPTRDDSVNVRETSNTTSVLLDLQFFFRAFCSTRKHTERCNRSPNRASSGDTASSSRKKTDLLRRRLDERAGPRFA